MSVETPLKLFWWRGRPNFGDRISVEIVAKLSGREIVWAERDEAELFAAGSVLRGAIKHYVEPGPKSGMSVWGTGLMNPGQAPRNEYSANFLERVDVVAVRGPLTAEAMKLDSVQFGDPGILCDRVVDKPEAHGKIAFVKHYAHEVDAGFMDSLAEDERFVIVDPSSENPWDVVRAIGGARFVFSSSLHGLITADCFGVPNQWMDADGAMKRPEYKFTDYAQAIGRQIEDPVTVQEALEMSSDLPDPAQPLSYAATLEETKAALEACFPAHLKA